jgi:hypothetical protein
MSDPDAAVQASDTIPIVEFEQRRFVRYNCKPPQRCRFFTRPEFQFGNGLLRDISACGFCLILDYTLPERTELMVEVRGQGRRIALCRSAHVLHVKPDGSGCWLVGCQVGSPFREEEMSALRSAVEVSANDGVAK